MVRLDARAAADPLYPIDWLGNGNPESGFALDVNFDGRTPQGLLGAEDWSKLGLNQIGSRRNVGGLFKRLDGSLAMGPMSLAVGRGDTGRGDTGRGDTGRGDTGSGDTGRGDTGRGDTGRGDTGRGDTGRGDTGRGDTGRGDTGGGDLFSNDPVPGGELDFETASDLAKTPPNEFTACVIGVDCPADSPTTPLHSVSLGWKPPNVANVHEFVVYRLLGAELVPDTPATPWTEVRREPSVQGVPNDPLHDPTTYAFTDSSQLVDAAQYTYFAVAVYPDYAHAGEFIQSDPSNVVTITAVNDPPVAGSDSYTTNEDTPLTVAAPGVLANDQDADSAPTVTAVLVTPPSHGTLTLNADGSFAYIPAANYSGADSFTYNASLAYGPDGPVVSLPATVSITILPVDDAPVAGNDSYSMLQGSVLTIAAPGVLGNDTDVDSPSLTAVLVSGPAGGTLSLNTNGSFTYTPAPSFNGLASFTYRASSGSVSSNVATVSITVNPAYSLVGIQNVPPAVITKSKAGSTVPMKWQFRNGSTVVNSAVVHQAVTVVGIGTFADTDSGSSSFRYDATTNTWIFNLQTKNASGVPYPPGTYTVRITPTTPGYLPSPPFTLTLTK
jgi:hypothetical protein